MSGCKTYDVKFQGCIFRLSTRIIGLVQDYSNSIANVLELPQSYTKPSIFCLYFRFLFVNTMDHMVMAEAHLAGIYSFKNTKASHNRMFSELPDKVLTIYGEDLLIDITLSTMIKGQTPKG